MFYLSTVEMPKYKSDAILATGKRRPLDANKGQKTEPDKEEKILNTCIVCKQAIPAGRNGLDKFDVKYHYTECYIKEGKFSETFKKIDRGGSVTEDREKKYRCLEPRHDRPMFCKDYLLHMGIVHHETKKIMLRDSRPGIDKVISFCYSENTKPRENTKNDPIKKEAAVPPVIETNITSFHFRSADISAVEEENVDDPGEEAGDVPPPTKILKTDPELADIKERRTPLRLNKQHRCLICLNSDQFLISANEAKDYKPLMWHYAQCLFEKKMFQDIISAGPDNVDDYLGTRFKYQCPIPSCDFNNSKRNVQTMGLKSYTMHCAVEHNQLEVALAQYNADGIEEVREAVLHHRKLSNAPSSVTMPEKVFVEEIHACVLCKDEPTSKEATKLSFRKPSNLKYHYAGCYYDNHIDIMVSKYPPGSDNINLETGRPIDEIGKKHTYSCDSDLPGCKKEKKNKSGYKTFCIHKSVVHGGLMEIMESDSTAGIRYVYDKLQKLM